MSTLATLEDLPRNYVSELSNLDLTPLWPSLRNVLPYGPPLRKAKPALWKYDEVRPLLLQAGDLTPIEKAERRVLVLCNPGYPAATMQATPSIYVGLQLILPREDAPNHRHSPSALRMIVEGSGGYTSVQGEKLPMEPGDLVLTPSGQWHEHGHEGRDPVIWMDALDLPLIHYLECSYAEEANLQHAPDVPDASQTRFRRAGLLPYREVHSQQCYPMMRYPWRDTRAALQDLAPGYHKDELIHIAYVNPITGQECLPLLGCSAIMLRPGETAQLARRTASAVIHALEGAGEIRIDDHDFCWQERDILALPSYAGVEIRNRSDSTPAFLFMVDDAPLHRKLRFYREFPKGEEL